MEYRFEKFYETEYCAIIEADSYEEALAKLTNNDFEQCDKPYLSSSYVMDEDGEEIEWDGKLN